MTPQLLADLGVAGLWAVGASITCGFLYCAVRERVGGDWIVLIGAAFCFCLDGLLTFVNTLPRP